MLCKRKSCVCRRKLLTHKINMRCYKNEDYKDCRLLRTIIICLVSSQAAADTNFTIEMTSARITLSMDGFSQKTPKYNRSSSTNSYWKFFADNMSLMYLKFRNSDTMSLNTHSQSLYSSTRVAWIRWVLKCSFKTKSKATMSVPGPLPRLHSLRLSPPMDKKKKEVLQMEVVFGNVSNYYLSYIFH